MLLYILGMFGIAAFAITGVISAGKKDMDIFSVVFLGMVAALGGGTIRDTVLSVETVYWVKDSSYLWVAFISSATAFFTLRFIDNRQRIFHYADSFGLALFTVVATEKVLHLGFSPTIAITMGIVTGIAGGMIRDILSHRPPLVLGREFYATPAFIGASFIVLLQKNIPSHEFNSIYAVAIIFSLRVLAIHKGLYYPRWLLYKKDKWKPVACWCRLSEVKTTHGGAYVRTTLARFAKNNTAIQTILYEWHTDGSAIVASYSELPALLITKTFDYG